MKILIIGAGVIGCTYGFQLAENGNEVTHYLREKTAEAVMQNGVEINCLDARNGSQTTFCYHPDIITHIPDDHNYELIIVSANCTQLVPVLELLRGKIAGATVLIMQNMRPKDLDTIPQYIGKDSYLLGFPFIAGGERKGTVINCSIYNKSIFHTMLGEPDGTISPRLKTIEKLFASINMRPSVTRDMRAYVKVHYVWASAAAAAYIKAGSYRNYVEKPQFLKESYLAMREVWQFYKKDGVRADRMSPTRLYYFPLFIVVAVSQQMYDDKLSERVMVGHVERCKDEIYTMFHDIKDELAARNQHAPIFESYEKYIEDYYNN